MRGLRRSPGVSALVIATLALAVGANSAVFSIANEALFRPVPGVADSEDLLLVQFEKPDGYRTGTSWPAIETMASDVADVASLTTYTLGGHAVRPERGPALSVLAEAAPTGHFAFLGVGALLGRLPGEEAVSRGDADAWVVLSEQLWERGWGRDPAAIGQAVELDGVPFTIVGVAEAYHGASKAGSSEIFFPLAYYPDVRWPGEGNTLLDAGHRSFFPLIVRPEPGVDADTIERRLRASMERLATTYPAELGIHEEYVPTVYQGIGTATFLRADLRRTFLVFATIVGLVLLIACSNVASLLVARGLARRGDAAVRVALGASTRRVMGEVIAEGVLLALPAAALGIAVAGGLTSLLVAVSGSSWILRAAPSLDGRVVAFTATVAMLTGVVASVGPALLARAAPLHATMVEMSPRHSGRSFRIRSALCVVQLALALVLIVGASLLARTLSALHATDLGFESVGVSVAAADPRNQGYDDEAADALFERLRLGVDHRPETSAVAVSAYRPFNGSRFVGELKREEQARDLAIGTNVQWISPGYFDVLGQRLLAGRFFTRAELEVGVDEVATAVILCESLATELFGGAERAIGRPVAQLRYRRDEVARVVGVVSDARMGTLRDRELIAYYPFAARMGPAGTVVVKSNVDHATTMGIVRDAMAELDAGIPIARDARLEDLVRSATSEERLFGGLLALMAALAVSLACVGVYGVVAYGVAQRRREFGVRIALGADGRELVRGIIGEAGGLALIGATLGLAGAAAFGQVLESRLYGVQPFDAAVYGAASLAFLAITLFASAGPAREAARADPIEALRAD